MVWIKKKNTGKHYFVKRAVEVKSKDALYCNAHTRKGYGLNQQKDCKTITEKKLTDAESQSYNRILDEQRFKDDPLHAKSYTDVSIINRSKIIKKRKPKHL